MPINVLNTVSNTQQKEIYFQKITVQSTWFILDPMSIKKVPDKLFGIRFL